MGYEKAIVWLKEMPKQNVEPNSLTYRRLICSLEAEGQLKQVLQLWDDMREAKVEADWQTYEAAVSACNRTALWEPLLELFAEMKEKNMRPTKGCILAAQEASQRLGL